MSQEGNFPEPFRVRARWKRALRAPGHVLYLHRLGLTWRQSFRIAHWCVWYRL